MTLKSFLKKARLLTLSTILAFTHLSCSDAPPKEAVRENTQEVEAYYAAHPDFFQFLSPEKLPQDLDWQDGSHLPEFASPEAIRGGTLHTFIPSFPATLRPVGPDSNSAFRPEIHDNNSIGLIEQHPNVGDDQYYPGLAKAWALSEDNKTIYFKLDPDAHYSDGVPVTTKDFFFLFFFMRSSYIQAPWSNNWYSENYTAITHYDDHTFSISVPRTMPDPFYLVGGLRPAPSHFYKSLTSDYTRHYQWEFPPTTGPYELLKKNIKKGKSITLTRVKNWWAKDKKFYRHRYNPEKIHYKVIRDPNKAFETFKRGNLDMFAVTLPEYWHVKTNIDEVDEGYIHKTIFFNEVPRPSIGLYLNADKPILSNKEVRSGLHYAINFDAVIEIYFYGDLERLRTREDGQTPYTNPRLRARPFDPKKARTYFAKAGFRKANDNGILMNDQGETLSFTFTHKSKALAPIFPFLKEEALKAGVDLKIEQLDVTTAFKKVSEKNHKIYFGGFAGGGSYPAYWQMYHSENAHKPQTNNITNIDNPELDSLIDAYDASGDKQTMIRLSHDIQEIVYDEAVFIPGFYAPDFRVAYWRWIRFPKDFATRRSSGARDYGLFWIDESIKRETLKAEEEGETFEPQILTFDQWKPKQ